MASTFFGLTIAGSGLTAYQAAINVTANNISNVKTNGYTRQELNQTAAEALRVAEKYGMIGSGTEAKDIVQVRDNYYDTKFWNNNCRLGEYDSKYGYLKQIEAAFQDDDNITGFSTIYAKMNAAMEDLLTNPSDETFRNQFINYAESFCEFFHQTANTLQNIQKDANAVIYAKVQEINAIANSISLLNHQINTIELEAGRANDLRDQRAVLLDKLSSIIPIETKEVDVINSNDPEYHTGATKFSVTFNGHVLVDTFAYNTIECVTREYCTNQTDSLGFYDLRWEGDKSVINLASSAATGELKGLFDIRDGNNAENFKGRVAALGEKKVPNPDTGYYDTFTTVTISKPSQKTIEELTLGIDGKIKLDNKYFMYSEFQANDDGTYTFTLTEKLPIPDMYLGTFASVGESVDFKGVPYYMQEMNEFIRTYARQFNDIHMKGQDKYGNPAGLFYTGADIVTGEDLKLDEKVSSTTDSYYKLTAFSFKVNSELFDNANLMSTSSDINKGNEFKDIATELQRLYDKTIIFKGASSSKFLETVLSDIAIDTNKLKTFTENYSNITESIKKQRMSISGVDEDEEAMALIKFQNAYNMSSRMVQCMSEIYNRLILETGV